MRSGPGADASPTGTPAAQDPWLALPALPAAWEKKLAARRDAALQALAEPAASATHRARVDNGSGPRSDALLELEMTLGIESPAELQAQRLALQVRQLRDRFQSSSSASPASTPADRLVAWCALPGVADARDRTRAQRIFSALEKMR